MIKVVCEACGKSFGAKDELAGRRGKCPGCGEPIVVPQGAAPTPAASPHAAPSSARSAPARRTTARAGKRAAAGGGSSKVRRRGREGGKDPTAYVFLGIIVIALAAAGGYFVFQGGTGGDAFTTGLELKAAGKHAEAIAQFDLVPAGDPLHARAQEERADTEQLMQAGSARVSKREADGVYNVVMFLEDKWVDRDGKGSGYPDYASQARYMLKRAADFVERFPQDSRRKEIEILMVRYEDVADPAKPPTRLDVDIELGHRMIFERPNYADSLAIVEEFATAHPERTEEIDAFRTRVQDHSFEYWKKIKDQLNDDGSLAPGEENWRRVAQQTLRYLEAIDGLPLVPVSEARLLHEKALGGGG